MLLQNNASPNAILLLLVAAHYVSAVPDSLPALPDHHANPDPGLTAVLRAFLPHRAGNQPAAGVAVVKYESLSALSPYTERPSGDPATPELHRVQRAPAHSSARLPWATQGKAQSERGAFFF